MNERYNEWKMYPKIINKNEVITLNSFIVLFAILTRLIRTCDLVN